MSTEVMDLDQLASYLQRDVRDLARLASRGYLPGRKVGGQWKIRSTGYERTYEQVERRDAVEHVRTMFDGSDAKA